MNENSLNNKLTRVDDTLSLMKHNLSLSENAVIEDLAKATNLHNLLNVFIQMEEPEKKDGVWLQTQPFDFVDFTVDENMHIVGELEGEDKWPADTKPNKYNTTCTGDATGYYISYSTTIYRYMYNEYRTIEWYTLTKQPNCICSHGGYLYVIYNGTQFCRINTDTKEAEELSTLPANHGTGPYMAAIDDKIYLFKSGQMDTFYAYNINTKEFETLTGTKKYLKSTINGTINQLPIYNGKIFVPNNTSGSGYSNYQPYWYDPATNTWTVANVNGTNIEFSAGVIIGNDMYFIGGGSSPYLNHVNLIENVKERVSLPFSIEVNNDGLYNCGGQLVYSSAATRKTYTFAKDTSAYNHDTIVMLQGAYKSTNYLTSLYTVPRTGVGAFKWAFSDIYPYINGELIGNIPSYYGDGEKWIKFKN